MDGNQKNIYQLKDNLNLLAEKSGMEYNTKNYILRKLELLSNPKIFEIENSCSLIAVFQTNRIGKTIAFRADIDAVNINNDYQHLCGHDGHTAILLTLANIIDFEISNLNGTIILIFQAAEETGQGARKIISSNVLKEYKIDYIFGLHNLPGFPANSIVVSENVFAKASSGIKINLIGKATHAAEPAKGIPMEQQLIKIVDLLHNIANTLIYNNEDLQLTITHINFGKPNFGSIINETSIYAVIRSSHEIVINKYKTLLNSELTNIFNNKSINYKLEYCEEFPATVNSTICVNVLKDVVENDIIDLAEPFPWSEDFGHYSEISDICLFGLGIGENSAPLHTENYVFPKESLIPAVKAFESIIFKTNHILS